MKMAKQKMIRWHNTALKRPELRFVYDLQKVFPQAEIYLVGGAVRDILLERPTKDYDFVITKVSNKELEKFLSRIGKVNLVGKSFGVFKFRPKMKKKEFAIEDIDIALPRTEHAGMSGGYKDFDIQSDKDLPIEKDLSRRDFTINAMAWNIKNKTLVDEFYGLQDLKDKLIRAIGKPEKRFQEDYTRMLRAIRFSCQLNFAIENETLNIINKKAKKIITIAPERINDEFIKIIMSNRPDVGIYLMEKIGLLKHLLPELTEGVGVSQNKAHIYTVFEHNVRALKASADYNYKLEIRLAALFHDIGKPHSKEGEGENASFHGHETLSEKMAKGALKRLNFKNDTTKEVLHLIRYHMFYYAIDTVSDAGVRRLLNRLGADKIDDFICLRICDRLGMGRPKAKPWKLQELERRLKEVQLEPITPKMLKLNGNELMKLLNIKPSKKIGLILNALLGEILENPKINNKKYLTKRAVKLNDLPTEKLKNMNPDIKYYEEERKRNLH